MKCAGVRRAARPAAAPVVRLRQIRNDSGTSASQATTRRAGPSGSPLRSRRRRGTRGQRGGGGGLDAVNISAPEMGARPREALSKPVPPPSSADLVRGWGRSNRLWAATLLSVFVQAYNTTLIKPADLPRTYD